MILALSCCLLITIETEALKKSSHEEEKGQKKERENEWKREIWEKKNIKDEKIKRRNAWGVTCRDNSRDSIQDKRENKNKEENERERNKNVCNVKLSIRGEILKQNQDDWIKRNANPGRIKCENHK